MTGIIKTPAALILIAVAFVFGSAFGWFVQRSRSDKQSASVAVVHEVVVADLCATALQETAEGRTSRLQRALETRMASAVNNAVVRVPSASPVGFPVPNLVEGVNRVRRYAVAKGMADVVAKCDRLLEYLKRDGRA